MRFLCSFMSSDSGPGILCQSCVDNLRVLSGGDVRAKCSAATSAASLDL